MTPRSADDFTEDELRRIEARWKSDVDLKLDRMDSRLHTIERLVWTAVGGTAVVAAIATIGITLVMKQGERIDAVAVRQAGAIAQREANDKYQQEQIDRLRMGEKR